MSRLSYVYVPSDTQDRKALLKVYVPSHSKLVTSDSTASADMRVTVCDGVMHGRSLISVQNVFICSYMYMYDNNRYMPWPRPFRGRVHRVKAHSKIMFFCLSYRNFYKSGSLYVNIADDVNTSI